MDAETPESFREWLRAEALARGFARVGFADCAPFGREGLDAWFAEGRGEPFPWLKAEDLADPGRVLEGARTALVGFFPYARPEAVPGAVPGTLKLSRYLWGKDYHMILKPRLTRLLEAAQARRPGLRGRVCVDTAPVLERQLAVRAGLGWQGKHTLLIAGRDGSWGFLGVLLLDADLPPDRAFPGDRCGTCTRCIEACPTGAIAPFRMDPRLCMTTYTVETEAEPPAPVARALAATGWAAGCDICQEACPWNRAPVWGDPGLWGGPSPLHGLPEAEASLGCGRWQSLTRRTALRRVRHRHWLATVARIRG